MLKACIGLNCARHIDYLDRRHCNLTRIPEEVWRNEQHLEELLLDMNGLQDLPPKFFRITNLRKLTVSENELLRLSPMISNLSRLVELDVSKNALEEIPDNIKQCKCLALLEISSNPLLKVPECLTMIKSLTVLAMNDCSLPRLPTDIGNLENLQVLEARENLLKSIPRSIESLKKLIRLDLGNNEIEELPPEIGCLVALEELWLDSNQLRELPEEIGQLHRLVSADITKNKLEFLPPSIQHLVSLKDLHVSENYLTTVPDTIGFNSNPDKPGKVNKSCDSHMTGCWQWVNTVKIYKYGSEALRDKIAMFDLDYTLISTQSGRKFSCDETDWKWLMPQIPSKLHELWSTEGYSIIIISNQAALSKKPKKEQEFTKKCELISPQLGIPHRVYAATDKDKYRKPLTGMWDLLLAEGRREGVDIKRENCLYVGDAAGRSEGWAPGKKKDFSCSDRKFASNLQVAFFTPEEFFLKQKAAKFSWGDFDPREILQSPSTLVDPPDASITSNKKEIVVFVGFPASGKSTFFKEHMSKSYGYASRDVLKTWQNCVATSETCITKEGRSVVIDNTNPDVASRERYIGLAKELNVPLRCFYFTTTLAHSRHNNVYRELTTLDPNYKKVPELAFNMYESKFMEPTLSEGFDEVVRINFVPLFKTEKEKELYAKFLT